MQEQNEQTSVCIVEVYERVLSRAADRIESGWCRDHQAVDEEGYPCDVSSARAVRFCGFGAIVRETQDDEAVTGGYFSQGEVIREAVMEAARVLARRGGFKAPWFYGGELGGRRTLERWNDSWQSSPKRVADVLREAAGQEVPA